MVGLHVDPRGFSAIPRGTVDPFQDENTQQRLQQSRLGLTRCAASAAVMSLTSVGFWSRVQGPDELADMLEDVEASSTASSAAGGSPTAARPGGRYQPLARLYLMGRPAHHCPMVWFKG